MNLAVCAWEIDGTSGMGVGLLIFVCESQLSITNTLVAFDTFHSLGQVSLRLF